MSRSSVTTSLDMQRVQSDFNNKEMHRSRPQTARASLGGGRVGASSPYNAPPSDPLTFGLRPRSGTQAVAPHVSADSTAAERSIYFRVPKPPSKEYRPLRAKSSYERTTSGQGFSSRQILQSEQRDSLQRAPENLARQGFSDASTRRVALSARGRMQGESRGSENGNWNTHAFGAENSASGVRPNSPGGAVEEGRGVAIFPTPTTVFAPPPTCQDPNPRRRLTSTMHAESSSMPNLQTNTDTPKTAALVKELGPAMSAIASLTHETQVGKLVRHIEAVVLVLLEADACRVCLYDKKHKLLQVLRPGASIEGSNKANQLQSRGISGLVAESGSMENVPVVQEHPAFDQHTDIGSAVLGKLPKISYLCAPARDKTREEEVVAVISAMRTGSHASAFSEHDESMMGLVAGQAAVALSHAIQRHEMVRAKWQHKVLVKAAIELTSNLELEQGALCCLAGTFARKLTEADYGTVCLTSDQNKKMKSFDLVDLSSSSPKHEPSQEKAPGERPPSTEGRAPAAASPTQRGTVKMQEHLELPLPAALKKVVTTGTVCNMLVSREGAGGGDSDSDDDKLPAGWPSDGKPVSSVFGGETTADTANVDSCLAVPLQISAGSKAFGVIQVINRNGGPRKVGRHGVFSKGDEDVLRELGFIVAAALQRVERIQGLEGALKRAPEMTAEHQEPAVMELLKAQVTAALHAEQAVVFLLDPDGNWELFQKPEDAKPMRRPRNQWKEEALRLPPNTYPLAPAAAGWEAQPVKLREVHERILARKGGLMTHATAMIACAIRDIEGTVYGVLLVASRQEDQFPRHAKRVIHDMCVQAGTVLKNCLQLKQHEDNAKNLQHASLEMLDIVKKREMEQIMGHVAGSIATFMCCSRAVLYMVDVGNRSIWTIGPDENLIVTDIKEDADPTVEGSRAGFANIALAKKEAIVVKDFAYGQHAFNDLLDSADVKHVDKLTRLHSVAANSDQSALLKLKSELEPEERTESTAVIPIRNSTKDVVAVLQVMNRWKSTRSHRLRKEGFDVYDMDKLALIGEAVAFSLENAAVINRRFESETNLRNIAESRFNGLSVGLGTAAQLDVEEAMSYAASKTAGMCGATQVALYLLDNHDQMDSIRFEGNLFRPAKRIKNPITGVAGLVASSGQLANVEDVREHPSFDPVVDQKQHLPVVSLLCCPVFNPRGRIIGSLAVMNKKGELVTAGENTDPFTSHGTHSSRKAAALRVTDHGWASFTQCDEEVVKAAAQGIGMALTQFQLFNHVSSVADRLQDISVDLEQQATLERVAAACEQVCQAQRCLVFLLDDKTFQMVYAGAGPRLQPIQISADYGLPGAVRRNGGTLLLDGREEVFKVMSGYDGEKSALNKAQYDELIMQIHNAIVVPITNQKGRIVGVLEVANRVGGAKFDQTDERVLRVLASHAYSMIQHCRAFDMQSSKRNDLEEILHHVVSLVQEVARSFPQHLSDAATYKEIVRATCQMLGAHKGHLYFLVPGDYRHWIAYDDEGNVAKERTSRVAMSVLEHGTLMNNTRTPSHKEKTIKESEHSDDDEAPEEEEEEEEEIEEPDDSKMMCAPILSAGHLGIRGRTVIGALEVEAAGFTQEWTTEHEEVLKIMAGIAASLLDIMRQIRQTGTPATTSDSGKGRKGSLHHGQDAGGLQGLQAPRPGSPTRTPLVSSLVSNAHP